jgi:hypothetical protein
LVHRFARYLLQLLLRAIHAYIIADTVIESGLYFFIGYQYAIALGLLYHQLVQYHLLQYQAFHAIVKGGLFGTGANYLTLELRLQDDTVFTHHYQQFIEHGACLRYSAMGKQHTETQAAQADYGKNTVAGLCHDWQKSCYGKILQQAKLMFLPTFAAIYADFNVLAAYFLEKSWSICLLL